MGIGVAVRVGFVGAVGWAPGVGVAFGTDPLIVGVAVGAAPDPSPLFIWGISRRPLATSEVHAGIQSL